MRIKLAIKINYHTQILCVWLLVRRLELYFLCLLCLLKSQLSFCAYPCVCLPESGNLEKAVLVCASLEVVAAKALPRFPPRWCLQAFILVRTFSKIPASWQWKTDITRAKAVPSSFSLFLSTECLDAPWFCLVQWEWSSYIRQSRKGFLETETNFPLAHSAEILTVGPFHSDVNNI